MNKKIILTTLPFVTLLLSSCFQNNSKSKKTSNNPTDTSDVSGTDTSNSETTNSESTSTSATSTTQSSTEAVFNTAGESLPFSNYSVAINDKDSGKNNRDLLMSSINSQVGEILVSSITADNCTILTDDSSNNKEHFHLTVGTGSSNGFIQFNLSRSYQRIEVTASGYYKTYSGGSSKDDNAKILINGVEYNFTTLGADPHPQQETFTVSYEEAKTELRFANDDEKQRFYLDSVKIIF